LKPPRGLTDKDPGDSSYALSAHLPESALSQDPLGARRSARQAREMPALQHHVPCAGIETTSRAGCRGGCVTVSAYCEKVTCGSCLRGRKLLRFKNRAAHPHNFHHRIHIVDAHDSRAASDAPGDSRRRAPDSICWIAFAGNLTDEALSTGANHHGPSQDCEF